jgi:hypothetical protein
MWIIPNDKGPAKLKQMVSEDFENARQVVKQMGLTK